MMEISNSIRQDIECQLFGKIVIYVVPMGD